MRYLVAMLFAVALALAAMLYVSGPLASWAVSRFTFDNPYQVNDLHVAAFMGANFAALVLGWLLGWIVGGLVAGREAGS